jgi:hypothetical protein
MEHVMRISHFLAAFAFPLAFGLAATSFSAHAGIYKWKDADGNTVISDTPQPGSGKAIQTPPAPKDAAAPKSWAEQDLEFKKRQLERRDAQEKADKEAQEAQSKKANCLSARDNLATLQNAGRISNYNAQTGQREFLDDAQRAAEIDRAKKSVEEWCGQQ